MSESTIQAAEEAFHTRELLKIRVLEAAPVEAREAGHALVEQIERAVVVHVIGRVVVLYRPFADDPVIRLPA